MAAVEKLERFRSYNKWLKEKFGERVYKVIVDAGFTCPNRDGTVAVGGCAYCNNNSFRPPSAIKTDPIRDQVREGIEYIRKRFDAHKFIIYFQPFSNTYAETQYLRQLYAEAARHGKSLTVNGSGEFSGSERCHITRELTKDQILAQIAASGGLFWHAPPSNLEAMPSAGKELLL